MFQESVVKSFSIDESLVAARWAAYQEFIKKIDFIKDVKEEKYQDGFLSDIFEKSLGYTLETTNPQSFNIERERKNETDSKKADGVIYVDGKIVGIIELKAQDTKNLDRVQSQAFYYLSQHQDAKYVIISNFDELRFYIEKSTAYERFSLFNMDYESFKKLHLLLSFESITDDIPLKIREKSNAYEQNISKELYRDYSQFRLELFENIVKNNYRGVATASHDTAAQSIVDCHASLAVTEPRHCEERSEEAIHFDNSSHHKEHSEEAIHFDNSSHHKEHSEEAIHLDDSSHCEEQSDAAIQIDKPTLLRLTQKLCDRIIFILFAEDRGLLRTNTIREIREEFIHQKFTSYSLYDIYKFYFDAISEGNERLNIPKYNGGMFARDELLDSLIIDDEMLDERVQKLSNYDFLSDVSVNILGHIFEQSLTDLEELQANIENTEFDKTKSKRKKDGVFYTPEYITRYIVQNTLGKMCEDKRAELGISAVSAPKNLKKLSSSELQIKNNLESYKNWLLNLKILDPACGSGAFLNQALEFLINEHKTLQNDLALMGDLFASYMVEETVLEHNLYGVDINEDAVEIAKLSLWLRTAKRGRVLTKLSDKIICANSLLEMPFAENSFDVVIGNPPYVRQEAIKEQKEALSKIYKVANGTADLYVYFYELAIKMLRQNGIMGYICSNKFFRAKYGENLREYILENTTILKIADFNGVKVFEDATVDSAITIFQKQKASINSTFKVVDSDLLNSYDMKQSDLTKTSFSFSNPKELAIKQKIEKIGTPLKEWNININYGIKTGFNEAFIIDETTKNELIKKDTKSSEIIKPLLRGRDIKRYEINFADLYLIGTFPALNLNIDDYPAIKEHLNQYYEQLEKRSDKGATPYNLRNCAYLQEFLKEKIVFSKASKEQAFSYTVDNIYLQNTSYIMTGENLKFLLALLNSKLSKYIFLNFLQSGGINGEITIQAIERLPIPKIDKELQKPFIALVDEILESKQKIKDYRATCKFKPLQTANFFS